MSSIQSLRRVAWIATLLAVVGLVTAMSPARADDDGVIKVVYHADFADPKRFGALMTMVNNMANYYDNELQEYDIRIVFLSHGIRFVTDNPMEGTPFASDAALEARRENLRGRLASLTGSRGVKLEVCNNTRSNAKLDEDALYEGAELVPSGVVRLAELQREGFAYIKVK